MTQTTNKTLSREATQRIAKTKRRLFALAAIGALAIIGAIIAYRLQFTGPIAPDKDAWGQFGDYLGGLLNPVLSFFGLLALLYTILLQQEELAYTREEMAATKKELERSAKAQEQLQRVQSEQLQVLKIEELKEDLFRLISTLYDEIKQLLESYSASHETIQKYLERQSKPAHVETFRLKFESYGGSPDDSSSKLIPLSHYLVEMRYLLERFRGISGANSMITQFMINRYKVRLGEVCDQMNAIGFLDAPTRDFFTLNPRTPSRTDTLLPWL